MRKKKDSSAWYLINQMSDYKFAYTYAGMDTAFNQKTNMKTLTPQQEVLFDADTKILLQAGFLNDDLTPSGEGFDALEEIQFAANKEALLAAK